jgi:hypothetical protein
MVIWSAPLVKMYTERCPARMVHVPGFKEVGAGLYPFVLRCRECEVEPFVGRPVEGPVALDDDLAMHECKA